MSEQNVFTKTLCAQKDFLFSQYQRLSMSSIHVTYQVRNDTFEEQANSFSWCVTVGVLFLKSRESEFKMLLKMSAVLAIIVQEKSVCLPIHGKIMVKIVTGVCKLKQAATRWLLLIRTKNQILCCLTVMSHYVLSKTLVLVTQMNRTLLFLKQVLWKHTQPKIKFCQKQEKSFFFSLSESISQWFLLFNKKVIPGLFLLILDLNKSSMVFRVHRFLAVNESKT